MPQPVLNQIGRLTLPGFHAQCVRMVYETAASVHRRFKLGGVRIARKDGYDGTPDADVVTSIDKGAQAILTKLGRQLLPPQIGWIGEENGLRRASQFTNPTITITLDPVDGTRSLIAALQAGRPLLPGQVAVMLGVQVDGVPMAGYICDVPSLYVYCLELYGRTVMRIAPDGREISTDLLPHAESLEAGTLIVHGKRDPRSPIMRGLVSGGLFGRVRREGHSIGLTVCGAFSGQFSAVLRPGGTFSTPWDDTPLQAMCSQGSVVMLKVDGRGLTRTSFDCLDRIVEHGDDILYLHRRHLRELSQHVPIRGV